MLLQQNDKLVMLGDSVTDCGRLMPVGEGVPGQLPFGNGYVNVVQGLLGAWSPQQRIRVVNMGVSGNQTRDVIARWKTDVEDQHPDWLSILIGVNDVWRIYDTPLMTELHVTVGEYEANMRWMLDRIRSRVKGLVLMTPYVINPDQTDPMRRTMDEFGAVCRSLAGEYDCQFVDLQAEFDDACRHLPPTYISWDRIHPTFMGHCLIARAFLRAVEVRLE